MNYEAIIEGTAKLIELLGVAAIVVGFLMTAVRTLRCHDREAAYPTARRGLGRSILLGLELLVAADIVRTTGHVPTLEQVGILAIIVLMRSFLSFTIEVEINGRLPWREARAEERAEERERERTPTVADARVVR